MITQDFNNKMESDEKILTLKVIDGTKPKSTLGMTDPRLFTGENKIHVKQGPDLLWYMYYDKGNPPPAIVNQKFTTFTKLKQFAQNYFSKRNLEVIEVIK